MTVLDCSTHCNDPIAQLRVPNCSKLNPCKLAIFSNSMAGNGDFLKFP